MLAYRRPVNFKDWLTRADCKRRIPKEPEDATKSDSIKDFLQGGITTNNAKKQTLLTKFFKKSNKDLSSSCSLTNLSNKKDNPAISSKSVEDLAKIKKSITRQNKCSNKKCIFCPILNKSGKVTCTATGETHNTKINITCKSNNLVYCITCRTCLKQYVGQTKNSIAQRFYSHTYNIRNKSQTDGVGLHFSRADHHGFNDLQIQILEFINLPPDSACGKLFRLKMEKKWIHTLRTIAPRGLNLFD